MSDVEARVQDEPGRAVRGRGRVSPSLVFWATALTVVGISFVRARELFTHAVYPMGDGAVNSLLVVRAEHFHQLAGNYSRVGFHHPGPAFLYLLGAGETVLHNVLGLVPAPYNGQLLGASGYVGVVVAFVTLCVYRSVGSLGAALCAAGTSLVVLSRLNVFANDWFPFLYISTFLLFVVTAAALGAGRTGELPLYVLACCLLVHGHVSFTFFVAVTSVFAAGGWWLVHKGRPREELAAHRRGWLGSLAIAVAFALPLIVSTVRYFPDPWRGYLRFVTQGDRQPRSLGEVVRFVASYWTELEMPVGVLALAAVIGIWLAVTERDTGRMRLFLSCYIVVALQSGLTAYYVARGIDTLRPRSVYGYAGYFYYSVPLFLLLVVVVHAWLRLADVARARAWSAPVLARVARTAVVVLALAVAAATPQRHERTNGGLRDRSGNLVSAVQVVKDSPARAGRRVALVRVDTTNWLALAGVAMELHREGVPFCIEETSQIWQNMFTPVYACNHGDRVWRVGVAVDAPKELPNTLWHGAAGGYAMSVYAP